MQSNAPDHDEYLTADTLQWCTRQWDILNLPAPQSNHFIRAFNAFTVPSYYKYLIHTARTHEQSGHTPRLQPAPKPYGGYGWDTLKEVDEYLTEGRRELEEEG
jgi:hypothetical protein